MSKTAIITGLTGQDGSFLTEFLLAKGYKVIGVARRSSTDSFQNVHHLLDDITLEVGDLTDGDFISRIVDKYRPDEFYNLGAQSFVPVSWSMPQYTTEVNALGPLKILESIRNFSPHTRFYQASTSEMFGKVQEMPQKETTPFYPRSPYGVSKCLTARTLIYTENGLVQINKVRVGDMVWSHDGQLHSVSNTFSRKYVGKMINIIGSSSQGAQPKNKLNQSNFQLTCTEEHPILTKSGWKRADTLSTDDIIYVVSTKCKVCGNKIPANRVYCSKKCQTGDMYADTSFRERNRKHLLVQRQKLVQEDYWNSEKFKASHARGVSKHLKSVGINYMEFYLDLLIQNVAPGFFKFVGDGSYEIDGTFPDWINEEKKAIIEYVGFGETLKDRMFRFNKKVAKYELMGYRVLTIFGHEFKSPVEIKHRVSRFCSDLGSVEFVEVKIKNIKSYDRNNNNFVYDLEVEDSHSFIANGIVVHNCYAHWITVNYRESYNLFACSGILFNHESERRGLEFVTRKISTSVAKIKLRKQDKLYLGNLDAKRDWGHSKDYVEAMYLMLQQDKSDTYVIGSDETHSVREFCDIAFKHVGLNYEDYVEVSPEFFRPAEVDILLSDSTKARTVLDWKPKTSFESLVKIMVDCDLALEKHNYGEIR